MKRGSIAAVLALAWTLATTGAQAQTPPAAAAAAASTFPSFAQMEAAGARISRVRVITQNVFNLDDPAEDNALFRLANRLHPVTRPRLIERELLFQAGDRLSTRVLEENERILRANRFIYDVAFVPVAYRDGVVDIDVVTRDTWTLDLSVNVSRSGGVNNGSLRLREYNLLGTGTLFGIGRFTNADRSGTLYELANAHAFGHGVGVELAHENNSDGRRDAVSVTRPFRALDDRWTAGAVARRNDRVDPIYLGGKVLSEYRHQEVHGEAYAGWSPGWDQGWVRRYIVGLSYHDDRVAAEPGTFTPPVLPDREKRVGPFLRYELLEDRYEKELNRNLIGRPEFFALGLQMRTQLGLAPKAFGSNDNAIVFSGSASRGFEPAPNHTLIAAGSVNGQWLEGSVHRTRVAAQAQYYYRQAPRWLFYAAASAEALAHPADIDFLYLGGDNGMRGYPLRYQAGTRRALFTLEERFYTDIDIWRLFRLGGAAFVDVGRAWGGPLRNADNPGWLSDIGAGLRIVSTRSAFSNVIHIDVAVPLRKAPDVKKVQFSVRTRSSF